MDDRVFLSYSRIDENACRLLEEALEDAGVSGFRDESIEPGDHWLSKLQHELQNCSAFVVLIGSQGLQRWVGAEVECALVRHYGPSEDAKRLPIFPVLLKEGSLDELPSFLKLHQATSWSPPEPVPAGLLKAIKARAIRRSKSYRVKGCPFLGLKSFQRHDAQLFFGRRNEIFETLAGLGDPTGTNHGDLQDNARFVYYRWLQIEGNSGAGKSSLLRAGLLPMIERGMLWLRTGFEHWQILPPMLPGADPVEALAVVLEHGLRPEGSRNVQERYTRLKESDTALKFSLSDYKKAGSAFLLIIDQFEELFTVSNKSPREQFDRLLAQALQDADCPLFVISTIRVDFLERIVRLPQLSSIYNTRCRRYLLPTISEAGLREVIEEPALLAGLNVQEVIGAILKDARGETGALPLVENALVTLWKDADRKGGPLSWRLYVESGGLAGMLSSQADAALQLVESEFPRVGKQAALELLLRLTRISGEGRYTRRRILLSEAIAVAGCGDDEMGSRIVELLSGGRATGVPTEGHRYALRLITTRWESRHDKAGSNGLGPRRDAEQTVVKQGDEKQRDINQEDAKREHAKDAYVELIHETLVDTSDKDDSGRPQPYWPTLYTFIEANRDRDVYRQELELQTEQWLASGWFGRWRNRASWRDLRKYRKLRIAKRTPQGRFLFFSRVMAGVQLTLIGLVLSLFADSALWVTHHDDFPIGYVLIKPLWRLGLYKPMPKMVLIPSGTFEMGCKAKRDASSEDECVSNELPVTPQRFDRFSMGQYEVTFLEYDYYVWSKEGSDSPVEYPNSSGWGRFNRPVINVTWDEAQAYVAWLRERTGDSAYRLPTEAQWEYAARAGDTKYGWKDRSDSLEETANCGNGSEQTRPVGALKPNDWGLYDTAGNVWEWVEDVYTPRIGQAPEQGQPSDDSSKQRVLRGGAWDVDAQFCRAATRGRAYHDNRTEKIGFRVCCGDMSE